MSPDRRFNKKKKTLVRGGEKSQLQLSVLETLLFFVFLLPPDDALKN